MKKLLFGIVLALSGCLTYNEPPVGREQDRFMFFEIFLSDGTIPASEDNFGRHGVVTYNHCSEREARYLFKQDFPDLEILAIYGHFAIPNHGEQEFQVHLLTADEVEEARNR